MITTRLTSRCSAAVGGVVSFTRRAWAGAPPRRHARRFGPFASRGCQPITLDTPELAGHRPGPIQNGDLPKPPRPVPAMSHSDLWSEPSTNRELGGVGEAEATSESATDDHSYHIGRSAYDGEVRSPATEPSYVSR